MWYIGSTTDLAPALSQGLSPLTEDALFVRGLSPGSASLSLPATIPSPVPGPTSRPQPRQGQGPGASLISPLQGCPPWPRGPRCPGSSAPPGPGTLPRHMRARGGLRDGPRGAGLSGWGGLWVLRMPPCVDGTGLAVVVVTEGALGHGRETRATWPDCAACWAESSPSLAVRQGSDVST